MTQRPNPFVQVEAPAPEDGPELPDLIMGARTVELGPQSPETLDVPATGLPAWPRTNVSDHRAVTVFGLHGGAGASTVAALFDGVAVDAGTGWPVASGWVRPLPTLDVLAVARTHYAGLEAAESFTQQWAAGELPESRLLGLVLVDDGPNLSKAQVSTVRRLLKKVPKGAHLPWIDQWRHAPVDPTQLPSRVKKIVKVITNATRNGEKK